MTCVKCGRAADHVVPLQEVLTLTVRGFGQVSRVQALGAILNTGYCFACVDALADKARNLARSALPGILGFAALTLAGVAMLLLDLRGLGFSMKLPGAAAAAIGPIGLVMYLMDRKKKRDEALSSSKEENRARYLPALLSKALPKKAGENDVTYVILSEDTQNARAADLAIRHKLLPKIALQLQERAHLYFHPEDAPQQRPDESNAKEE